MRVLGIDVAPARGAHIYEGGSSVAVKCPKCLAQFLEGIDGDALLAWDAPLTACTSLDGLLVESDLTRRIIEAFFAMGDYKVPKGISVQGYSGCQHWTISRRLLGLPRIGLYDRADDLPFKLVSQEGMPPRSGRNVVEVHPGLALWVWFRSERANSDWEYKKNPVVREGIWTLLKRKFAKELPENLRFSKGEVPNDDELDAVTAWLLADDWQKQQSVCLLGNERLGTFLLPEDAKMRTSFDIFSNEELHARQRQECHCG